MTYHEYLASDHWQTVRSLAIKAAGTKCEVCGRLDTLQAHHRLYRRSWLQTIPSDLVCLCETCHKTFHRITNPKGPTIGRKETIQLIKRERSPKTTPEPPFDRKGREEKWREARKSVNKLRIVARKDWKFHRSP